jgi:hypothetical protein
MQTLRACLVLLTLGCAEPTFTEPVAATRPDVENVAETGGNSFSVEAGNRTVYVRLAQARGENGEPIHAFMRRMFETADASGARRLVIDLRSISGSDSRLAVPLIRGILTRERFAQAGGLVVVVGDDSFSARQSAAALLQQYAHPTLVRTLPR